MTRKHVVIVGMLLALLGSSALAAPKKKKKKKAKEPEPAAEPAAAPEPTPAPTPEPAPAPEPAAQTGGGGAGGSAGGDASAGGEAAVVDVAAKAAAPGAWPMEIIDRPPTLVKGLLRGDVGLPIAQASVTDPVSMMSSSSTSIGLGLGVGYGISDKLEAGVTYGLSLKDFEAKGPLGLYGAYSIMHQEKLKGAGIGSFTYDLAGKTGALKLGLFFQYNLTKTMAVYTPGGHLRAQLIADDPDGAGPLEAPTPIDLHLPVGFAYQASKNIYAFAETSLATIKISQSATAIIFADTTPLTVGAFYSMSNKIEFGAQIATGDVPHIGDAFTFSLVARLFTGDAVKGAVAPMPATGPGM